MSYFVVLFCFVVLLDTLLLASAAAKLFSLVFIIYMALSDEVWLKGVAAARTLLE